MLMLSPLFTLEADPIYVYKEKGGSVRFSSRPPPAGVRAEVFSAKGASYSILGPRKRFSVGRMQPDTYRAAIQIAARAYGLEPALIQAVIHTESAFQPSAVSPKGAQGLMQLMPAVAREMGVRNVFDPSQNIYGGCRYLALLLKSYGGNLSLALAAYNAGPAAVERYGGVPPYTETREYVQRVLMLKTRYAEMVSKHPRSSAQKSTRPVKGKKR